MTRKALADSWYATGILGDICDSFDELLETSCPGWVLWLSRRIPGARSIIFFWLGRKYDLLVTRAAGSRILLCLEAWFRPGKGHVVLLEFIASDPLPGLKRAVSPLVLKLLRAAFRRTVVLAQVMTGWERDSYPKLFGVEPDRFRLIPWFGLTDEDNLTDSSLSEQPLVLSSGRAACDWQTLFRAAEGRGWPLTIVCGSHDLPLVTRLNRNATARVLSEIPLAEHDDMVRRATVYVLSLREIDRSSGQIRVRLANRVGTPVVASRTRGLVEYAIDGQTALLVEPGDYLGLRAAVERVLQDPDLRRSISRGGFEMASRWTLHEYKSSICEMVSDALYLPARSPSPGDGRDFHSQSTSA